MDLAFVDEHADRRGGHRLGGRADGEERVGVDGVWFAELPDTVALLEDDAAVFDDGDREADGAPVFYGLCGVGIELAGGVGSRPLRRREADRAESEGGREQGDATH